MITRFARFDLSNLMSSPARVFAPLMFILVIGVINPLPLLTIPAAAAVVSLGAGTPFLNDERGRLDVLYATLPITKRSIVIGRYLEMLLWYVMAALLATSAMLVSAAVRGFALDPAVVALVHAASFFVVAAALAVQLPIFFSYGFTRARAMMFVPIVVVAALCSAAVGLGWGSAGFIIDIATSPLTPVVIVLGGLAVLAISSLVAIRFYRAREL